jgi:hypothetical protein
LAVLLLLLRLLVVVSVVWQSAESTTIGLLSRVRVIRS